MAGLTRTEKYKDLRERLQSDTSGGYNSKELSRFASRLNRIDSDNFAAPDAYGKDTHTAEHRRRIQPVEEQPVLRRSQRQDTTQQPAVRDDVFRNNENYTATFDNDYLDRYIREVKQYNLEQGNAVSEDTQVNILRQLDQNQNRRRPYAQYGSSPLERPVSEEKTESAQIPVFPSSRSDMREDHPIDGDARAKRQAVQNTRRVPARGFTDDLFEDESKSVNPLPSSQSAAPVPSATSTLDNQNLTKEDIMAEVQNLVNGRKEDTAEIPDMGRTSAGTSALDDDARQQLLNETTQMRAQLDSYEDNLNEVSDKMRHTNQILNIVLVVLIIALALILMFVIYFIMTTKG